MSDVAFILGRAGTGKSRLIRDQIVSLLKKEPVGAPVYLLVPRQSTFEHERYYALAAGLPGFCRLRVVGFEDLGEDVLAECGGDALPRVTGVGRQVLIGHLLRKHADDLKFFGSTARQVGLVGELDRTFSELDRAGLTAGEIVELLDAKEQTTSDPDAKALAAKARDLALLGDVYLKALGDRIDATRRLERVAANLEVCRSLREAHLFVDAFYRMSGFERRFLAKLAALTRSTRIAITLDPDDPTVKDVDHLPDPGSLFGPTLTLYRQLNLALREADVTSTAPTVLRETKRFLSPTLGWIERDWSMPRPSVAPADLDGSSVRLLETAGPEAEADAAARQVRDWQLEGYRLREIVVLCRDLSGVQERLTAAFAEHEIPVFIDRRRPAQHHPLVRFVRALLSVATRGWLHASTMELCKSGLAGMDFDDADTLENYVLEHRIRGRRAWTQAEPWAYRDLAGDVNDEEDEESAPPPIDEDARRVDALRRRLAEVIEPLSVELRGPSQPAGAWIAALWGAMEGFDVPRRLSDLIGEANKAENLEEAEEHKQAWDELISLFDQVSDLLGAESLAPADFVTTIEYGLDLLNLAIVPPTRDQVLIGEVDRTRTIDTRAVVVIGLNEGEFPRSQNQPSALSDEERRLLRDRQVDVEADGRRLQLEERFLGYIAFTRAAERLTLIRSGSAGDDDPTAPPVGRATAPSSFWQHVETLLKIEPERVATEAACEPSIVATPRQLVTMLLRAARSGQPLGRGQVPLYDLLRADGNGSSRSLVRLREQAWPALSYDNGSTLSHDTIAALYADGLHTSASRLESFAACPFKHFATHILRLRERSEDEVSPRDLGTVYHGVLERLIRQCIRDRLHLPDAGPELTAETLPAIVQEIGEGLRNRIMLGSARSRYLLDRIRRTLEGVLAGQQAMLRGGKFTPLATELQFGADTPDSLPPLEYEAKGGRRIRIYGQIDRVDHAPRAHFATVFDYKFSGKSLSLAEVKHGVSLQLLLYLLVLQEHGARLSDPPPQPVAALYVKLIRGLEKADAPPDRPDPEQPAYDLRTPPRGLIDADALPLLDSQFFEGTGRSTIFKGGMTQQGRPVKSGDVVTSEQFEALLDLVRANLVTLGERIMEGDVRVRPYLMGGKTPCTHCSFKPLCRFDPAIDSWLVLDPMSQQAVLEHVCPTEPGDDEEAG